MVTVSLTDLVAAALALAALALPQVEPVYRDVHERPRTLPAARRGGEINVLFEPFLYKNDLFTKTGSGQT
eukprot:COSAG06_NODE_4755_length_3982_cov_26.027199_3_plen_70_part_00